MHAGVSSLYCPATTRTAVGCAGCGEEMKLLSFSLSPTIYPSLFLELNLEFLANLLMNLELKSTIIVCFSNANLLIIIRYHELILINQLLQFRCVENATATRVVVVKWTT